MDKWIWEILKNAESDLQTERIFILIHRILFSLLFDVILKAFSLYE